MDQYAVAANANHYDKHALKYASAEEVRDDACAALCNKQA